MRAWERVWVAGVLLVALVATTGLSPDAWPFVSWQMFSSPGPVTSDTLVVVADTADGPRVHRGERLPGGYLAETYQGQLAAAGPSKRRADCRRMLADLASAGDGAEVRAVTVERWTWTLLERDGDRPAAIDREPLVTCERAP